MYHEVGVVIPYYHFDLKETERISLEQCIKILGKYPIIFLVPDSMSEADYPLIPNALFEVVPREWLLSAATYNQMMLNEEFYQRFEKYKYILIHQLDAFVFSDRLLEMCRYGYDYIGAPWLAGYFYYINSNKCIWRVGNGGFSLRKVDSIINLLKKGMQNDFRTNEDIFFAISDDEEFRVAPIEIALKFSFETQVRECFSLNKEDLPFGCHAWEKHDYSFWKPYIEGCGYNTGLIEVNGGNGDDNLQYDYTERRETAFFWEKFFQKSVFKQKLADVFSKEVENYIIWGIRKYERVLCKILEEAEVPIRYLIDGRKEFIGKKRCGYEIRNIEEIHLSNEDAVIIAMNEQGMAAAEQLERYGYTRGVDYVLIDDLAAVIKLPSNFIGPV